MFTENIEFQSATKDRKIELIRVDAFNAMIKYLKGHLDHAGLQSNITTLSHFGFLSKTEITTFLKERIFYEAYQYAIGKNETERDLIRKRFLRFKSPDA